MLAIAVQLQQATANIACFEGCMGGVFCICSESHVFFLTEEQGILSVN